MKTLLAATLCSILVFGATPPCGGLMFATAFEYYQHAEQYFATNDFIATTTGVTAPSIGKPQVMYGTRQRHGSEFFYQSIVLGASTLGKNPSGAMQRFRDDKNFVSYRNIKTRAPKRRGDIVSIDFGRTEWTTCTPQEYIAKWKTSPERLTPFNITTTTPSKLSHEKDGSVIATFYIDFHAAKDYADNIKASSNLGVKSGDFTVTITFDKTARAIQITEHSTYKMSILTNPTVTASITETIEYKSAALPSKKNIAGEFLYNY